MPHGQVGEIAARDDQTMMGYWRLPDATADMIDADHEYGPPSPDRDHRPGHELAATKPNASQQ